MNVANMIVFAPIIHKGIRFASCGPGWALFLPSSQRFWWKESRLLCSVYRVDLVEKRGNCIAPARL